MSQYHFILKCINIAVFLQFQSNKKCIQITCWNVKTKPQQMWMKKRINSDNAIKTIFEFVWNTSPIKNN